MARVGCYLYDAETSGRRIGSYRCGFMRCSQVGDEVFQIYSADRILWIETPHLIVDDERAAQVDSALSFVDTSRSITPYLVRCYALFITRRMKTYVLVGPSMRSAELRFEYGRCSLHAMRSTRKRRDHLSSGHAPVPAPVLS